MGKRSNFERKERDFYPTPYAAVEPLLKHLDQRTFFNEPCAGDGALIDWLEINGHVCTWACDIEPQRADVVEGNALEHRIQSAHCYITNPPWDRSILHPLIDHLSSQAPTWLLFDADWIHTKQAKPYLARLAKIVSVGRLKWIPGSKMTGKDNCCWYLFMPHPVTATEFYGRM